MSSLIQHAARLLREAEYAVALTGAGVSTPSGIPDFRSPGSGLWAQVDPMEVASRWSFLRHPERFYAWVQPLAATMAAAKPNSAHRALAALETAGVIQTVITQNIDGLHQAAGSRNVLEVHGHFREAVCLRCATVQPSEGLLARFQETGQAPRCGCGGILKPNVVLFGDPLPPDVLQAAQRAVRRCDVMLVAGSSLEVVPAGDWPGEVVARGGKLIIVNMTPTAIDAQAAVVIHGDVSQVLPEIAHAAGVKVMGLRERIRQRLHQAVDRHVPRP